MKKVILSTIAASALLSVGTANAATYPSDQFEVSHSTKKPIDVKLPNLKDKAIIEAMKNGIFEVNGIKMNTPYSEVINTLGKPKFEDIGRMDESSYATAAYKNIMISASSEMRTTPISQMKVSDFFYDYSKKKIKLKDIKGTLGKTTSSDTIGLDTKTLKDDYLNNSYGHLNITMTRETGDWTVQNVSVVNEIEEENKIDPNAPLKNAVIKPLKIKEIKAIQNGKFSFKGLTLGMKHEDVLNKVGESEIDNISNDKKVTLTASYGNEGTVSLNYQLTDKKEFTLKSMNFSSYTHPQKLATIEKSIGKATKAKYDSYTSEENGKKETIKTVTKTYGKHLVIDAEKQDNVWTVQSITYK